MFEARSAFLSRRSIRKAFGPSFYTDSDHAYTRARRGPDTNALDSELSTLQSMAPLGHLQFESQILHTTVDGDVLKIVHVSNSISTVHSYTVQYRT